ncbi:MAG: hypothetical protein MK180_03320 [Rhodobacteraceae bacterium]|nr:hypothetical protein [Paracoccaceae bacterium]
MVGAAPNTAWLSGLVELDDKGFVKTGVDVGTNSAYSTSNPGIFAVGDVHAGSVKRVASAVGEGSVVISRVWEFINGYLALSKNAPLPWGRSGAARCFHRATLSMDSTRHKTRAALRAPHQKHPRLPRLARAPISPSNMAHLRINKRITSPVV